MSNLEPCPYCGGAGALRTREERDYLENGKLSTISTRYKIACRSCSCGTPWLFYEEDAIASWNKWATMNYPILCRVGDTVYSIGKTEITEAKIHFINIHDNQSGITYWCDSGGFDNDEIGKIVFLTRAEAERALKERRLNDKQ